jgi:hypothetical protein
MLAAGVGVGKMVAGAAGSTGASGAAGAAAAPPKPGQLSLANDTRFAIEFQDDTLAVFYLLDIVNSGPGPAALSEPLIIDLPAEATAAALLDGASPLASVKGRRVSVAGPLPLGVTTVPIGYRLESWDETWTLHQAFPLPINDVALVVQKVADMRIQSPSAPTVRDSALQGTPFMMGTGGSLAAGTPLQLTITGLPHKSRVPIYLTLAIAAGLAAWGVWLAASGPRASADAQASRRRELQSRRDRGLAALATLERRRSAGGIDQREYVERRRGLIEDLERIYSELDDRGGLPGGGQGLAA